MSPTQTTEIRDRIYADAGRVGTAVRILATETTLAEHVTVSGSDPVAVEITDSIPFELWGSGTRALWLLACSIAYSAETVSLYKVASALDLRNTAAAGRALGALFGGVR